VGDTTQTVEDLPVGSEERCTRRSLQSLIAALVSLALACAGFVLYVVPLPFLSFPIAFVAVAYGVSALRCHGQRTWTATAAVAGILLGLGTPAMVLFMILAKNWLPVFNIGPG
jgi:hypothetical protein